MIRKKLSEITLRQYNECLRGNTLVLLKFPIKFKVFKRKTDNVFTVVSEDLSSIMQSGSNDVIVRMFHRIHIRSLRLRILTACYQGLSIEKHKGILETAAKHGFKWNDKLDYIDNLRQLAGIIDRINNEILQESKRYESTIEKTQKDADNHSLYDIIVALNHITGSSLSMDSSLEHFVSVNKLSKEIIKMSKKNK